MLNNEDFANYLGLDFERHGNLIKVICPFHQDTVPSLCIYPTEDRGCFCFACGQSCSWAKLITMVKGVSFSEAYTILGHDDLARQAPKKIVVHPPMTFCDSVKMSYAKAFTAKHSKAVSIGDANEARYNEWLESKHLTKVAKELDWKWHSKEHPQFKHWGDGVLIPYKIGDMVVYERFRAWNEQEQKFEKPKGPFDVPIQPYMTTYRPNDTVFIAEGESDCASLYACGLSAIGLPGAMSKKAVNSAVSFILSRPYIKRIVCCGDKDTAGQKMNALIRQAIFEMKPSVKDYEIQEVLVYTVESTNEKADINDDYKAGLMQPPVQYTVSYGNNYTRQPWANEEFSELVDKLAKADSEAEGRGTTIWHATQQPNILEADLATL